MKILDILRESNVVDFSTGKPQRRIVSSEEYFAPYWPKFKAAFDDLLNQPVVFRNKRISFEQWLNTYMKEIPDQDRFDYVAGRLLGSIKSEIRGDEPNDPKSIPASQTHIDFLEGIVGNIHLHKRVERVGHMIEQLDQMVEEIEDGEPEPEDTFSER